MAHLRLSRPPRRMWHIELCACVTNRRRAFSRPMKTLFRRNVLTGVLAAALSLFALGRAATSGPCCGVKIRKDYVWLGHVTHLKPDDLKDLENALRYADKSLYQVNFCVRGKLQGLAPIGTLQLLRLTTQDLDEDARRDERFQCCFPDR